METKHTYNQIIIIPDVHGRDFWEPIVAKYKNDTDVLIIFLGDYLDPYTSIDGISEADAIFNFTKIINEASSANNIITLFGNHDLHYFPQLLYSGYASRRIEWAKYEMSEIFSNNRDMFKVAYETHINDRKYLFTHAGVLPGWIKWIRTLDEENDETTFIVAQYNSYRVAYTSIITYADFVGGKASFTLGEGNSAKLITVASKTKLMPVFEAPVID